MKLNQPQKTLLGLTIAAFGLGMAPGQLMAQSGSVMLEEILVTAQRREQNLQEVPVAVTAFSATQLEEAGVTTLIELEKSSPNTQLRESRGTNSTLTAFIRGIGQQDPLWGFEPGVGIYIDDVYIARPQGAVLDVYDVQRIEVLRGPQGTLYGKNTIGGAIKYVTAPIDGEAGGTLRYATGDFNRSDITVSGNMPLIEDTLFVGGSWVQRKHDGYGTQYKDYDSATGTFGRTEENYNKDLSGYRLSLLYTPSDDLSISLAADSTDDSSNNRCGSRFAANTVPGPNGEFFGPRASVYDSECGMTEVSNVEMSGHTLSIAYDLSDTSELRYIYASREGNTETFIDFDGTPLDTFEVPAVYDDDQSTHELQFNMSSDRFNLVSGLYYYEGNAAGGFDALFGQFGGGVLSGVQFSNAVFGDVDTESTSVYANLDYDLSDAFILTAGLRYTEDEKAAAVNRVHVLTDNSFPGELDQGSFVTFGDPADSTTLAVRTNYTKDQSRNSWSELSPTLKLSWFPSDGTMLFAGWSNGFKSGGFDMRSDAAVNPNSVAGYDPETVETLELGIKTELLDNRVRLNATVFKSDFTDMQVTVQAPAPAPAFFSSTVVNAGKAEIDGVELEVTAQLTEGLSANLALGYLNAEFIEVIDAVFGNVAAPYDDGNGNILPPWEMQNSPDWTGQLALNYLMDLGDMGSLNLNTSWSYRGETRMFDQVASILDQDSYSLWDAGVVWNSAEGSWSGSLHLKNINDKTYRTGGYNFPATAGEDAILGFYGAPRTLVVGLSYDF